MNKNFLKLPLIWAVLATSLSAFADTDTQKSQDGETVYEIGSQTRQWLDMQRDGSQASRQAQTLPGPVMDQVYQRYIKSFGHPVPDLYEEHAIGQQ
jgi:hypothetical protein